MFVFGTVSSALFLTFVWRSTAQVPPDTNDAGLHAVQIIKKHGYPVEIYYLTTPDDYIIEIHRIPYGLSKNVTKPKKVVLLMHGILGCSSEFVVLGPNRSLAFILADLNYDVWLGNTRGNLYSRYHAYLNPDVDKKAFWDFSFHEIGYYDLPTIIDFILETTGAKDLYYVAISQGCALVPILLSAKPEYNSKIRFASFMAPAILLEHSSSGIVNELGRNYYLLQAIFTLFGIYEVPLTATIRQFAIRHCEDPEYQIICLRIIGFIFGGTGKIIDKTKIAEISSNEPSSSSMKQIYHFIQLKFDTGFLQYNYGVFGNLYTYGTIKPPAYNLSSVKLPIAIYYGLGDKFINYQDVVKLTKLLPNVVFTYPEPTSDFNHVDFVYGRDAAKLVYGQLIKIMKQY